MKIVVDIDKGFILWGIVFILKIWLVMKFVLVKVDLLLLEKLIGGME